jgi:hypothetical protein
MCLILLKTNFGAGGIAQGQKGSSGGAPYKKARKLTVG